MNEQTELSGPAGAGAEATDLRSMLELMRKQAELEIARLNRKLSEREYALEQNVSSATERQAMQQDLATLQHTLGQKEQTLDRITEECRRLEDELEDQHVAFDGLKQEVQRKDSSLKAARDEVQRLKRMLAEIQEQSVELSPAAPPEPSGSLPLPPVEADAQPSPVQHVFTFSAGVMSGLAVLGLIALFVWSGVDFHLPRFWDDAPEPPRRIEPPAAPRREPGPGLAQVPPPAPSEAQSEAQPVVPPVVPLQSVQAPAVPPPTLRDRLRDGSLGPTLASLPGGIFRMGHNSLSGSDSGPEHEVRIAPFLIGTREVTFAQYDRFVRATGRRFPDDFGWGRGERPVVGVSWSDAEAYADWLTRQTGKRYRLPSEAEWELAARAGTRGSYWWGFGLEPGRAACFDCGSEWDNRFTAPVGSFDPSPYGLYDTAGNAQEWVADCYAPSYEGAPADGRPRLDADCTYRVARGGAYNKPSASMRTYARAKFVPETRLNMLGFRVARDQ
jgi:formylglycine-generating enzyme required for sulfatase activity